MRTIASTLLVAILLAPNARAATIGDSVNICAELRAGTTLASLENILETRGYTARDAGTYTGVTVRDHCPDLISAVKAQLS